MEPKKWKKICIITNGPSQIAYGIGSFIRQKHNLFDHNIYIGESTDLKNEKYLSKNIFELQEFYEYNSEPMPEKNLEERCKNSEDVPKVVDNYVSELMSKRVFLKKRFSYLFQIGSDIN